MYRTLLIATALIAPANMKDHPSGLVGKAREKFWSMFGGVS
jgi:hypothetical protein